MKTHMRRAFTTGGGTNEESKRKKYKAKGVVTAGRAGFDTMDD
jgi:hypothetical protein